MRLLTLSGSVRAASVNAMLLNAVALRAPHGVAAASVSIARLPIFSPDEEGLSPIVADFAHAVRRADAVVIASPEYVRGIPGGLKNAIDHLVSGDALIDKPIALAHASHRGDDMLDALRLVLATVSTGFAPDAFLRLPLPSEDPDEAQAILATPESAASIDRFLAQVRALVQRTPAVSSAKA